MTVHFLFHEWSLTGRSESELRIVFVNRPVWNITETLKDYGAKIDGSLQEMKCSSPENLIGHPVTDIEEDHLHCWTPIDFIYDAGIVIWLIALCVVVKKRRIIQSIFWCCFGSSEKPPHALPWWNHRGNQKKDGWRNLPFKLHAVQKRSKNFRKAEIKLRLRK